MVPFLLLYLSLIRLAYSTSLGAPVFALPVTNVFLSNDNFIRGVPLSIGTPPQALSFMPQHFENDTWVYEASAPFCDSGETSAECLTKRGGILNAGESSTSSGPTDVFKAGGDPSDTLNTSIHDISISTFVTDVLDAGDVALTDYPIGMPGIALHGPFNAQNNIGLGRNSTFLNALLAAKKIASRSYSWWWGFTGPTSPVQTDGQIVFGGYDAAKVQGPKYTQALSPPTQSCTSGMLVTISDILLDFPNGTSASVASSASISTCIQLAYPAILTLGWDQYYSRFETLTNTRNVGPANESIALDGLLYLPEKVYQGGLTIKMTNGFQLSVPNNLLVVPPSYISSDGSVQMNNSVREVLIDPLYGNGVGNSASLGRYFFQNAYLTVNYDSQTFTLSKANPTSETNLVPVGKNSGDISSPPSAVPSQPTNSGTSGTGDQTALSTGAIVGISIGSIAGGAAIAIAGIVFFVRRKRRRRATVTEEGGKRFELQGSSGVQEQGDVPGPKPFELMSRNLQEMPGEMGAWELGPEPNPQQLMNREWGTPKDKSKYGGYYPPAEVG